MSQLSTCSSKCIGLVSSQTKNQLQCLQWKLLSNFNCVNLFFFSWFLARLVLCEIPCDFSLLQSELFLFPDLPPVSILSFGSFLCVLLYLKEYLWVFLIMKHAFLSHQSGTPWYFHSKTSSVIYSFSTHFHWTIKLDKMGDYSSSVCNVGEVKFYNWHIFLVFCISGPWSKR